MLAAGFLFSTLILLFQTRLLKGCDPNTAYFVALLSSAMWAIHPIQIQAVTYMSTFGIHGGHVLYHLIFSFFKSPPIPFIGIQTDLHLLVWHQLSVRGLVQEQRHLVASIPYID